MQAASIHDIKKELRNLSKDDLIGICMRMGKFKKENKELLTYLLYEAHDEQGYLNNIKELIAEEFSTLPVGSNSYFIKKSLRKILRVMNRFIKYSEEKQTELELRIHFCLNIKDRKVPLYGGTVLYNIYQQQLKKINTLYEKLPEDLKGDYERDVSAAKRV